MYPSHKVSDLGTFDFWDNNAIAHGILSSKLNICFSSFRGASIAGMSVISLSYSTRLVHNVSDLGILLKTIHVAIRNFNKNHYEASQA